MPFGQLIIGPPGSGKSTYCNGMNQFLSAIGRKPSVINLDPANENLPYEAALNIRDFTTLEDVMKEQDLGPNGGIIYALEQLEESTDLFIEQVKKLGSKEYLLIDCPGQVELFTHHSALAHIVKRLEKDLGMRLVVVNLIDSYYLSSASQYISVLLLALRTMLQFDLPHINVLSKIDLISNYCPLPFKLDYYTEVQDLEQIYPNVEQEMGPKFSKLTEAIGDVVSDFGLVDFQVLAVQDKKSMISLLSVIDKASGYLFGSTEIGGDSVWVDATRQGGYLGGPIDIHERWIEHKKEYDEEAAQERDDRMNDTDEWNSELAAFEQETGIKATKWGE